MKRKYLIAFLLFMAIVFPAYANQENPEKLGRFCYTMPFPLETQNETQDFRSYMPTDELHFVMVQTGNDTEEKIVTENDALDHLRANIKGNCFDEFSFSNNGIAFAGCRSRYGDSVNTYLLASCDHSLILFTFNASDPIKGDTMDALVESIEVINPGLSAPDLMEQWMNAAYGN